MFLRKAKSVRRILVILLALPFAATAAIAQELDLKPQVTVNPEPVEPLLGSPSVHEPLLATELGAGMTSCPMPVDRSTRHDSMPTIRAESLSVPLMPTDRNGCRNSLDSVRRQRSHHE